MKKKDSGREYKKWEQNRSDRFFILFFKKEGDISQSFELNIYKRETEWTRESNLCVCV